MFICPAVSKMVSRVFVTQTAILARNSHAGPCNFRATKPKKTICLFLGSLDVPSFTGEKTGA